MVKCNILLWKTNDLTFTFGDSMTMKYMKKLALPCWVGNLKAEINFDVVN